MNYRDQMQLDDYTVDVRAKLCEYDLTGDYGIGYTAQGDVFYFDKEDYDIIKNLPWHKTQTNYMSAHVRINGKRPFILMHRLIMNAPQGLFVDHIGGNDTRNDNRHCNLRLATCSQNVVNSVLSKRNTSGIRGVRFRYNKWYAQITKDGKQIELGAFNTVQEATKARHDAELEYFGEFSYDKSQKESKKWQLSI